MLIGFVSISVVQKLIIEAEILRQSGRSPIVGSERSNHLSWAFEMVSATREEIYIGDGSDISLGKST